MSNNLRFLAKWSRDISIYAKVIANRSFSTGKPFSPRPYTIWVGVELGPRLSQPYFKLHLRSVKASLPLYYISMCIKKLWFAWLRLHVIVTINTYHLYHLFLFICVELLGRRYVVPKHWIEYFHLLTCVCPCTSIFKLPFSCFLLLCLRFDLLFDPVSIFSSTAYNCDIVCFSSSPARKSLFDFSSVGVLTEGTRC